MPLTRSWLPATKLQLPELTDKLRDTLTTNEMKSEHVYICDCWMLAHICSNGAFPAPKHPLGHTGDLGICARIGKTNRWCFQGLRMVKVLGSGTGESLVEMGCSLGCLLGCLLVWKEVNAKQVIVSIKWEFGYTVKVMLEHRSELDQQCWRWPICQRWWSSNRLWLQLWCCTHNRYSPVFKRVVSGSEYLPMLSILLPLFSLSFLLFSPLL